MAGIGTEQYWLEEWEDVSKRPCVGCKHYWGKGEGCNKVDCCNRPDLCSQDFYEPKEAD